MQDPIFRGMSLFFVETGDSLAGEKLGLLVLVFNVSRPIFIA